MDDGIEVTTETDAVAALARRGVVTPQIIRTASGREFLILPDAGGAATHFDVSEKGDQLAPEPKWIDQAVVVQTADSLIAYTERFGETYSGTSLFADIAANRIVAALDYHIEGNGGGDPARLGHRATLDLPHSVEWETWAKVDGKLMGQLPFARFLEENAADIEAPAAADLMEACRDLQANRKVNFIKAVRTASNNENFEFTDETTATSRRGGIEIPSEFLLRIPVYFGGPTYSIRAFLRWELVEGTGLMLGVQLHNREHVRQAVFKEVVDGVASATGFPAYFGRI